MPTNTVSHGTGKRSSRLSESMYKGLSNGNATHLSAHQVYLSGLAPSGRKAMETLLSQCVSILAPHQSLEQYDWSQLNFGCLHTVRSTLVECGYAVNTINMALAALRGVAKAAFNLNQMNAEDILRINAVKPVKGNAIRTGRRLSHDEIQHLLNVCRSLKCATNSARETAILMVALGAGLRCFELCALQITSVDLDQSLVAVEQGKGRKRRQIYVGEAVMQAIVQWLHYRGSQQGPLFNRILKNGIVSQKALTPGGMAHVLNEVHKRSTIPNFTPHDLRRTFITQLLENDVDLNTVRQLAGHSDVNTTVRYDKRDMEWQKRASQGISF